jgi:hypothetical protein
MSRPFFWEDGLIPPHNLTRRELALLFRSAATPERMIFAGWLQPLRTQSGEALFERDSVIRVYERLRAGDDLPKFSVY